MAVRMLGIATLCLAIFAIESADQTPVSQLSPETVRRGLEPTPDRLVARAYPRLTRGPVRAEIVYRKSDLVFDDHVGDAQGSGADVRRVVVDNSATGSIEIDVFYANRTCATGNDQVYVGIDADQNPATGGGGPGNGTEYLLVVNSTDSFRRIARWDGTMFLYVSIPSLQAACDSSGFDTWSFSRVDLGIGTGFNFYAQSFPNLTATVPTDTAPDSLPLYNYRLSFPPPPPPRPEPESWQDAPGLPSRVRYVGRSIKHVRLGEKLHRTVKKVGAPRVVAVACWSEVDWPSVVASAGLDRPPQLVAGFWLDIQPRWIHVAPKQCADVQALMLTRQPNGQRAYALGTVLHERLHAQGIHKEALTECYAVQLVYEFARVLGLSDARALRLEQLAVRKSRALAPRAYWDTSRCRDRGEWDLFPDFRNLTY